MPVQRSSKKYTDPDTGQQTITPSALKRIGKDRQIEVMRQWFGENYEDPVVECPYDSEEGGYIYINGGPFDAREEIECEFDGIASDAAIEALVKELEIDCWEWSGRHRGPDDDDYYEVDAALDMGVPIDAVYLRLQKLKKLLDEKEMMDASVQDFQRMMIYSFCITTLESFLSDVLIKRVMQESSLKAKYLNAINGKVRPSLTKLYELQNVSEIQTWLDEIIRAHHTNTVFHNIKTAKQLYSDILGVELTGIDGLSDAIRKRHDIVHRAGKDKNGNALSITVAEIKRLIENIEGICRSIDGRVAFQTIPAVDELF